MSDKPKTFETTITWYDPSEKLPDLGTSVFFTVWDDLYFNGQVYTGKFQTIQNSTDCIFVPFFADGHFSIGKIKYWAYLPNFSEVK